MVEKDAGMNHLKRGPAPAQIGIKANAGGNRQRSGNHSIDAMQTAA
jgi:hypothetical protein